MRKRGIRHKRQRTTSSASSFGAWFDRELAEINARLDSLAIEPQPNRFASHKAKDKPKRKQAGPAHRRARHQSPAAPPQAVTPITPPAETVSSAISPPTPVAPASTFIPTGTDLADPKNFGLMPSTADLERGAASVDEYRQRLSRHVAFATKVLHTSRVPAAVWREWRAFEKAAHERLRGLAS